MPSPATSQSKNHVSFKAIIALVWPQTLMMFFQFMVGITDVTVAGHIGTNVQATFGFMTRCMFFLLVIGFALANGGVAAISQALGAHLYRRAERYVGLMFKLGSVLCLAILFLAYALRYQIMWAVQVPDNILDLTINLWELYIFVIPAQFLITLSIAVFRSHKKVWVPFFSSMVVCTINMAGSCGLGLGWFGLPELGARGIVLANIISLWAGVAFNIFALWRARALTLQSFGPWRWERMAVPYLVKVALPAGGNQILWQLGYVVLFAITATLPYESVAALAGTSAGFSVEAIIFLPTMAFNFTAAILVGHCLGAGDRAEARLVGMKLIGAGVVIMSFLGMILYYYVDAMSAIVAQDAAVRSVAQDYLFFNILAIPFSCISMIVAGVLNGAGASLYSFAIFASATWFVRLPLAWYLGHHVWESAAGIFVAMFVSQAFQAGVAAFVFLRCNWYRFASTARRFSRKKIRD